ncbi:hypothetical protein [Pannonibacter sp. SL95]|uniref:hypothetical protein n=1 Tax=Pannonibacter sp. SL95 TaxID=2995153 RepID=UPI0022754EDE|nr:hypothetical protein [Pannonibacter sp. SL95]MCY1708102.1 hypothetical protein [Pannonibacter sp. SL95]
MIRPVFLSVIASAALIASASLAAAQTHSSNNQSSNTSSFSGSGPQGANDSGNPDSAPIICASRSCMDQQAATSGPRTHVVTHVPNREPRKPRKPIPIRESERCQDRWIQWPNGLIVNERECFRPLEFIR